LIETAAGILDVARSAMSRRSHRFGNHGDHRTLTVKFAHQNQYTDQIGGLLF